METKRCSVCKEVRSVDQFYPRRDRPKGYYAQCRECRARFVKTKYHSDEAYRKSSIANAIKSTTKRRQRPDVREQERIASREAKRRQLSDPIEYAKHLERNRVWVAANKEREAQYESRQPAAKAARAKRRHEAMKATPEGRAKIIESRKKWALIACHNRRARKLGAKGKTTRAEVLAQLIKQQNLCFWCGVDIIKGHTRDHYIALTRGGSNGPDNLVMACRSCNSRKWALAPEEFRRRLGAAAKENINIPATP